MFRLEYLKIIDHPQLGDLELFFTDDVQVTEPIKPYTSVFIGPNGTGKSYILRTVSEIFRQFQAYSLSSKKELNLPFHFHLRYRYYHNYYEIRSTSSLVHKSNKDYFYYKNKPIESEIKNSRFGIPETTGFEVLLTEIEFPERLLVNSIIPTDRFVQRKSNPGDFYQYLGSRSTSSTASTKTSVKRTINNIFNASIERHEFIVNLKDLLVFLKFEEKFSVQYKARINKLFFSGQLTEANFRKYFENWWDESFPFSKRKKENPSWSIPYYDKYFKDDQNLTDQLITYLNTLDPHSKRFRSKSKSSSFIFNIDLFDDDLKNSELSLIMHLERLDIINLQGIRIRKQNRSLGTNEISSGEYHMLVSLIGILANIKNNSIVLIDEPEISLHPNWQMGYVSFLKAVFSKFSDCHFVLATHSHFIVSDLEKNNSSVISLRRDIETNSIIADLIRGLDSFGWSAEEVLLEVFNVPTTRNYYIADKIGEILELVSKKERNESLIREKVTSLMNKNVINLSDNDPLKSIWNKLIIKYG